MAYPSMPDDLWIPNSWDDLQALPRDQFLQHPASDGDIIHRVVRTQPGVIIKYFGTGFEEEVICTQFAREKLQLPVPRVLYYPGDPYHRTTWKMPDQYTPNIPTGVWYLCTEEIAGTTLDKVIDTMTQSEIEDVATQLKDILSKMAALESTKLGSITGGSYRNEFWPPWRDPPSHAFSSVPEFIEYFRRLLAQAIPLHMIGDIVTQLPCNSPIRFAHADFLPKNIMVVGSKVTGIIDWATAGFYPEFWEYARMHDPLFLTPGWDRVLQILYPGARRQHEIDAIRQIFDLIQMFL